MNDTVGHSSEQPDCRGEAVVFSVVGKQSGVLG